MTVLEAYITAASTYPIAEGGTSRNSFEITNDSDYRVICNPDQICSECPIEEACEVLIHTPLTKEDIQSLHFQYLAQRRTK